MSFELGFGVVFELVEVNKLLVTVVDRLLRAVVDKLLVAVVDSLEVHILVVDILVTVLLAGKWVDIDLDLDDSSESEICNQGDRFVDQALIPRISDVL
ncbi:hypothetical protein G9A89_014377 [Geosiphon pyriformis]|nr:hypothetical protein G9A89_014377 [Geosiphon pyriformis]